MRASYLGLPALLLLGACSSGKPPAPAAEATGSASASASTSTATATAASNSGQSSADMASAYDYKQQNDLYRFEYSFPPVPPALAETLKREAESGEARLRADAAQARTEAKAQGFPYHAYEILHQWQQVANLPRFQSLSAEIYAFSGGAHGNTGYDALIWDKQTSKELKPIDLFTSSAGLDAIVRQPFCKRLDAERAKRRSGNPGGPDDMFNECIDPLEQTLLLGSSNGKTFDRLGFLIGPYAAGPYAEGSYDVTLPVTKAVLDQVKPDYQSYFSVMR